VGELYKKRISLHSGGAPGTSWRILHFFYSLTLFDAGFLVSILCNKSSLTIGFSDHFNLFLSFGDHVHRGLERIVHIMECSLCTAIKRSFPPLSKLGEGCVELDKHRQK